MTKNVQIDGSKIKNWDSFHDLFAEVLGFPGFYGRNMDAWNDCMTYLAVPEEGLTSVHVPPEMWSFSAFRVLSTSGRGVLRFMTPWLSAPHS